MKEMKHRLLSGRYLITVLVACMIIIQLIVFATAEEEDPPESITLEESITESESIDGAVEDESSTIAEIVSEEDSQVQARDGEELSQVQESSIGTSASEETDVDEMKDSMQETELETDLIFEIDETGDLVPELQETIAESEIAPIWQEADEQEIRGNIGIAEQMWILRDELEDQVGFMRQTFKIPESVSVDEGEEHLAAILGIYALMYDATENFPYGIELYHSSAIKELRSIYWEATHVTAKSVSKNNQLHNIIQIERNTAEELAIKYNLNDEERSWLLSVTGEDYEGIVQGFVDHSVISILSDEERQGVLQQIPQGISAQRRAVLLAALSLENKVPYMEGGKSESIGWDLRFGQLPANTESMLANGQTPQAFGLDYSGFVTWAFINGLGDRDAISLIGHGTFDQWKNSSPIEWTQMQPGDLVFTREPEDGSIDPVGIVVSRTDEGAVRIIYCDSGQNQVLVANGEEFSVARRPAIYGEEE